MAIARGVYDLFRVEFKNARVRREWSQAAIVEMVNRRYDLGWHVSTVAKIESGDRAVRIDELAAVADLFNVSADTLLGRDGSATDVVWATSKLSGNAQKTAADILVIGQALDADARMLYGYAERENKVDSVDHLLKMASDASAALETAHGYVVALAAEFPLPGFGFGRS